MNRVLFGDCRETMRDLITKGVKVQTCVTSPPYWGLRDYGVPPSHWPAVSYAPMVGLPPVEVPAWDGCLGLEPDPLMFVGHIVQVFRFVRHLLADDGTAWVQVGDCFRDKQLVGQTWRIAFALQADGWYLRRDNIWHKPNAMPETVHDRPATAHDYLFLLAKSARYYYDAEAVKEEVSGNAHSRGNGINNKIKAPAGWETGKGAHGDFHREGRGKPSYRPRQNESFSAAVSGVLVDKRHKRSVWTVPTEPFAGAHFATFPRKLIEPCILAGSRPGDIVLDPFFGSGTTGQVAQDLGRQWIGCELNQAYEPLQKQRTAQTGLAL